MRGVESELRALANCCRIYKGVANKTAKNNYRADVRENAVARVSAIRQTQKPKKETPARKPRGAQAKKAE